ncbi:MAG: hypothetical protein MUO31_00980 [Thermodesulfovibrionales bacterium]|nr:hypothetical protein [Thermodesulfovibrionales bacterium]
MVDYDGQDALKTYLAGLAWTALTEPTYFSYHDQKSSEIPNVVIVDLVTLTTERLNEDAYALHHHMSVNYGHSTKVNGFANLKYIITNLWKLSSSNTYYSIPGQIGVNYTENRKMFTIPISYTEIIAM